MYAIMHLITCQPILIFQKGTIEVYYFDKFKALEVNWIGTVCSEDYIFAMEEMLKFTYKYGIENWILDARESVKVEMPAGKWNHNFLASELPKTGLKKIARLASYNFHYETRISSFITTLLKTANPPFAFQYKEDTNEALEWFISDDLADKR